MLSRFVIAFLARGKCLLISWLQSPSAVIFEPPKTKSLIVSIVSSSIFHEVMGLDAMILVFLKVEFSNQFTLPPALRGNTLFKVSSPALNILVLLLF